MPEFNLYPDDPVDCPDDVLTMHADCPVCIAQAGEPCYMQAKEGTRGLADVYRPTNMVHIGRCKRVAAQRALERAQDLKG